MKKFNNDKIIKSIQSLLPRTFRSHIILSYLILAFGPFLFVSFYLYTSAHETIRNTNDDVEKEIVDYVVRLHQDHLDKQALLIESQLEEAKNSVLLARDFTEEIYTHKDQYPATSSINLTTAAEGYAWEQTSKDISNVGLSAITPRSDELIGKLSRSKYLELIFKDVVTSNEHVAAMYYITPESAWRMYPRMNVKYEVEQGFLEPDVNLTEQPFYSSAVENIGQKREVLLTDTYQDLTHRNRVFTLSTPIYFNGEQHGIIGADITIDQVMSHILNFQFKEKNAYAMLMSKSLNFIAYQDEAHEDINFYYNESFRETLYQSDSPSITTINREEKIFLFSPIQNVQWQLIYVIPKEEVLASITEITNTHIETNKEVFLFQFLAIFSVLILFFIFSLVMFTKYFMTPLENLLAGISSVSKGQLDTTIQVDYLDEFKVLAEAFNDMSNKVSTHLNNYKSLNATLENKVNDRTKQLTLANETLQETNQTLRDIENSRRELFSNIAHDLKTPITLVQGYVEAIQDGVIPEDSLDEYLDRIVRHLASINRLAKDLYELSIVEAKSSSTFDLQVVTPYSFFTKILTNYQSTDRIIIDIPKDLPDIQVDQEYIKRAIYNLIENSIKYSDPDFPIFITMFKSIDNMIHITVTDFGAGIPEEDLPHIFERFYRADKSRNSTKPGSGLGLAIVLEIIKRHHGKIEVKSKVNKGSTFTIILPIADED